MSDSNSSTPPAATSETGLPPAVQYASFADYAKALLAGLVVTALLTGAYLFSLRSSFGSPTIMAGAFGGAIGFSLLVASNQRKAVLMPVLGLALGFAMVYAGNYFDGVLHGYGGLPDLSLTRKLHFVLGTVLAGIVSACGNGLPTPSAKEAPSPEAPTEEPASGAETTSSP